jgi:hypothetical protein
MSLHTDDASLDRPAEYPVGRHRPTAPLPYPPWPVSRHGMTSYETVQPLAQPSLPAHGQMISYGPASTSWHAYQYASIDTTSCLYASTHDRPDQMLPLPHRQTELHLAELASDPITRTASEPSLFTVHQWTAPTSLEFARDNLPPSRSHPSSWTELQWAAAEYSFRDALDGGEEGASGAAEDEGGREVPHLDGGLEDDNTVWMQRAERMPRDDPPNSMTADNGGASVASMPRIYGP